MGHEYEKTVNIALELLKDAEGEVTVDTVKLAVNTALMSVYLFLGEDVKHVFDLFDDIVNEVIRVRG